MAMTGRCGAEWMAVPWAVG